jgi:hypothetical protein
MVAIDASIADLMRVCRAFAERQGWVIAQEYSDHAVCGAVLASFRIPRAGCATR